ncbi:MAG: mannosyltransferase [Marinilabiliales bacterium]|nr:MAG: mannosyltransferase [Marinilabiliales bacterium]
MEKKLHIVSFTVPFPADYGGVIDVFYKVKALHEAGYEIILHCFKYDRAPSKELLKYCSEVNYYKRKTGIRYSLKKEPYIVITRSSKKLLENLLKDDYPILFEGIHTTSTIAHPALKDRKKYIRMHNIEHEYYLGLASVTKKPVRKIFFQTEAKKLQSFEEIIHSADGLAVISMNDFLYYSAKHANTTLIPAFHENENIISQTGKGDYILYHGNLSVEENEKACIYLANNIFSKIDYKVIVAGKNPGQKLKRALFKHNNIQLIENPSFDMMEKLIVNAHINLLITFQSTGLKLKLLNALYKGRFCITNTEMVVNTGLEEACYIFDNNEQMTENIHQIMETNYTDEMIQLRKTTLNNNFSNTVNAEKLLTLINEE